MNKLQFKPQIFTDETQIENFPATISLSVFNLCFICG